MILTLLIFGIAWALQYPVPFYAWAMPAFVDGLLFLPVVTLIVVPGLRIKLLQTGVGRLHLLLSTIAANGTILVLTADGYQYANFDNDTIYLPGGETLPYDQDDIHWYRLGGRRFGITWDKDPATIGEAYEPADDIVTATEPVDGRAVLQRKRGGDYGFTHHADHDGDDGMLVSISTRVHELRGAGGIEPSERQERETLQEAGGGMSQKWQAIGGVACLLGGGVFGILVILVG